MKSELLLQKSLYCSKDYHTLTSKLKINMQKLKSYFISDVLERISDDPFEKMKFELTFNLLIIWIPISLLSIIPLFIEGYWYMIWSPFITTIGSFIALYLLKKTKSYRPPSLTLVFTSIIGICIMHLIGGGNLRGIDVIWVMLSIIIAFILLGKQLGFYNFIFNSVILIWSTLVFLEFIPPHHFAIFEHEQNLFKHPTIISALVPLLTIGYVLHTFLSAQEKAQYLLSLQKLDLSKKRKKIELVQKETEDSIYYAKRIQTAILPPNRVIKKALNNSFILYKPKDIVSGDFYWIQTDGNTVFFAVADCTGHGVPGAMISVVCMNALNRSIKEFNISDPAEILDKTRNLIISKFNKNSEKIKDGMDISLCALDTKNNILNWAGANTPLWVVRSENKELEATPPNKQPVGEHSFKEPFTSHSIQLLKNDMIYITTDGFADQFGGKQGKKYRTIQLKSKLIELSEKPLNSQQELLDIEFERWKGELDQLDDICFMGVRV